LKIPLKAGGRGNIEDPFLKKSQKQAFALRKPLFQQALKHAVIIFLGVEKARKK
jgi:hypothetical protein